MLTTAAGNMNACVPARELPQHANRLKGDLTAAQSQDRQTCRVEGRNTHTDNDVFKYPIVRHMRRQVKQQKGRMGTLEDSSTNELSKRPGDKQRFQTCADEHARTNKTQQGR